MSGVSQTYANIAAHNHLQSIIYYTELTELTEHRDRTLHDQGFHTRSHSRVFYPGIAKPDRTQQSVLHFSAQCLFVLYSLYA